MPNRNSVIAHAGLTAFVNRANEKTAGPAHAALAVTIAHQLVGLSEMVRTVELGR